MKANWIICDNHLALKDGNNIYHLSASEIYSFSDMNRIDGIECESPLVDLPATRFSKIGAAAKIMLTSSVEGDIYFNVYAIRKGKQITVDIVNGLLIDQCICDNIWFYITETSSIIQEIITKSGIVSSGRINLKQYLSVIEQSIFGDLDVVENHVEQSVLHKPVVTDSSIPKDLKATLFPYQESGYSWIRTMLEVNNGCILGDEMGLGKTMQVITEMLYLKSQFMTPIIVVAPISLLTNWQRECKKFAPSLNVIVHYGPYRISNFRDFSEFDVIITSYTTVISDIQMLNMIKWKMVVLDEAQSIKNPDSSRTRACKQLNRVRSLAVSGTPFENHITDIWSLVDFIQPGLLGTLNTFKKNITDDIEGGKKIEPILSALMVRRLVSDVAKDLPEKIVSTQPLRMSEIECQQYCNYLEALKDGMDTENPSLGMLQQLRIYCTHPYAVKDSSCKDDPSVVSVKYQRFCEIVEEIISRKEKVIVFTSYKRMFEIFEEDIPVRFGIKIWSINGETPIEDRQCIVDKFNHLDEPAMLVLNPRAAGTGLNITGANHVIHYNLEWNPSLEDQSSARAYRRGQEKTVFVYRLYYTDTVEEVVNERIERKRDIASYAIIGNDGKSQDKADILRALELVPSIKNN